MDKPVKYAQSIQHNTKVSLRTDHALDTLGLTDIRLYNMSMISHP